MTALSSKLYTLFFPRTSVRQREFTLVFVGALFVAIFAQIKFFFPFTPIPLTGQSFAVLLTGASLGAKNGAKSILLYILMGAIGLPVFAGGTSGATYLSGTTFGYLLGFVISAYLVGKTTEYGMERNLKTSLIPFLLGTFTIYLFGAGWLSLFFGFEKALTLGVVPFLAGDAIKLIFASLTLPTTWKITERILNSR